MVGVGGLSHSRDDDGLDVKPLRSVTARRDHDDVTGHDTVVDFDSDEAGCLAQPPHRL
jgi:hypothetical protein